jgi:hypothetical protein
MSFHEFSSDHEASEAGYPFLCSCGLYHSSNIGAAYCPMCKEAAEDHDRYVYRRVVNAATGEVVWESPFLAAAHAEEAARDAAEAEAQAEAAALAAEPLTFNPFAGAF